MASVNFRVKTNSEWNTIYFRFKQGGKFDFETSTGVRIPQGRWSSSRKEILKTDKVDYRKLNEELKNLEMFVIKEFSLANINGAIINSRWLKERINQHFSRESENSVLNSKTYLANFIDIFVEKSRSKRTRNNTPIKNRTIQHYITTKNHLIKFEEKTGKKLKLSQIDLNFHYRFITFLEEDLKLNPNTIGGYIDDIKKFCRYAGNEGLNVPNDYKLSDFYSPTNETHDTYLKEDEIDKIFHAKLDLDHLDNARDWFIIGLRTGQRIGDFLKLKKSNFSSEFITKEMGKTSYPVVIPIHKQVQMVLNKRNGALPRVISDQKFNQYIKTICEKVGFTEKIKGGKMCPIKIEEDGKEVTVYRKKIGIFPKYQLISSHTCRRSFATNLYGKLDTFTIMKIIGHKTEKQFLDYVKVTPTEHAEKLKALWKLSSHKDYVATD